MCLRELALIVPNARAESPALNALVSTLLKINSHPNSVERALLLLRCYLH
jgi:hypothetical protein